MNVPTPIGDRVVVKPIENTEERTEGGLYIPETATNRTQRGEVVATGEGFRTGNGEVIPLRVEEGDEILYGEYSPTEIKVNQQEFLIVRETDILAVF